MVAASVGAVLVLGVAAASFAPDAASAATLGNVALRRSVEQLVHQTYPDLPFGNVWCPDRVERRRGATFACTVQLPGTFLVVDGRETNGAGSVSLSSAQAVIAATSLQQFVAANSSLPATVDCGPMPWHAVRPGTKLDCATTLADGTRRTVELTVGDSAGNVTITAVT